MSAAAGALMARLIDYAGLFPPAGLGMEPAVAAYAAHRRSADAWMLGRFVVPVAHLVEFEEVLARLAPGERGEGLWELSGLAGADVAGDARAAEAFNARHRGAAVIRSVELRVDGVAQITAARTAVPPAFELFCELPLSSDLRWLLAAVRSVGARAKIRTGGVTAPDIPAPDMVLKFLEGCAAIRLPFKATAGLHHAVRGEQALTYEPLSKRDTTFGFLNVLLAAAALWLARPRAEALRLLESVDAATLAVGGGDLPWGASRFTAEEIARVRREFALSVGSCSFDEPVTEIRGLGAALEAAAAHAGGDPARGARAAGSAPIDQKANTR
ncbi:MAG: hypothetical protein ABSB58_11205 [Gemmatimonadales bacterium]